MEQAAYLSGVQDAAAVPVTVISNRENRGFPAAINQGLQQARGEYLVLLNNDVVVTDAWLDQLVALTTAKIAKKDGSTAKNAKNAKNVRGRTGKSDCADGSWQSIRQRPNVTIIDFDDVISDPFVGSSATTTPGCAVDDRARAGGELFFVTAYCRLHTDYYSQHRRPHVELRRATATCRERALSRHRGDASAFRVHGANSIAGSGLPCPSCRDSACS